MRLVMLSGIIALAAIPFAMFTAMGLGHDIPGCPEAALSRFMGLADWLVSVALFGVGPTVWIAFRLNRMPQERLSTLIAQIGLGILSVASLGYFASVILAFQGLPPTCR
jgi:hypothetical protein